MRLTRPLWARAAAATKTTKSPSSIETLSNPEFNKRAPIGKYSRGHDSKRLNIVSQELCDHAISVIRKSLPEKNSCDVIDVRPGQSIWSQTLHRELQPRRHVLIEPEWDYYKSYLDPLLAAEPNSYIRSAHLPEAMDLNNDLLSSTFIDAHRNQSADERHDFNNQLVISLNLTRRTVTWLESNPGGSYAKLFFDQYFKSFVIDEAVPVHKYGLVKLLAWVTCEDAKSINPRTVVRRSKLARSLEASCDIREIVSSVPIARERGTTEGWYGAILQSRQQLDERYPDWPLEIPPRRQYPPPPPPSQAIEPTLKNLKSILVKKEIVRDALKRLPALMAENPKIPRRLFDVGRYHETPGDRYRQIPGFPEAMRAWRRVRYENNAYVRNDQVSIDQIEYEQELIDIRKQNPNNMQPYLDHLEALKPSLFDATSAKNKLPKERFYNISKALDDYRLVRDGIMHWHRRTTEPLLCFPTDVYPKATMTLLEVTPKPSFMKRFGSVDKMIVFDYVNSTVNAGVGRTVEDLLGYLVGSKHTEVYADFVKQLPQLIDPLYGGYHDLTQVKSRALSVDHLMDIALAYEAWPFRKSVGQILQDGSERLAKKNIQVD